MAKTTRKVVTMVVTVSVPAGTSAAAARREVRTLIGEQCNWSLDEGEVKVRRIEPLPAPVEDKTIPRLLRVLKQADGALCDFVGEAPVYWPPQDMERRPSTYAAWKARDAIKSALIAAGRL